MNRTGVLPAAQTDRTFGRLATAAAFATWVMIVIGAVTRVTQSGMGCSTDWPTCNGAIIPNLADTATLIEFGHRLFAGIVALFTAAVMIQAWRHYRNVPRVLIPAIAAVVLYFLQAILGEITVKMSNEWVSVSLHMANSLLLLAAFVIVAGAIRKPRPGDERANLNALPVVEVFGAAILTFLVAIAGTIVAGNNARQACGAVIGQSWPLCFNQVFPGLNYGPLALANMTHRYVVGLLGILFIVMIVQAFRMKAGRSTRAALMTAFVPYILQALLGIPVILISADPSATVPLIIVRSLHLALAAAVWWGIVLLAEVVWLQRFTWSKAERVVPNVPVRSVTISSSPNP